MPRQVSFCNEKPHSSFTRLLEEAFQEAVALDVVVAFITQGGIDLFSKWAKIVKPKNCRLCVSVQFPTDLDGLSELYELLGSQLFIHLKSGPREKVAASTVPYLMHSKIVWVNRGKMGVSMFVGSHNWTSRSLNGVNLEASLRIDCENDDPVEQAVKSHINACINESVEFIPNDIDFYRSLQIAFFPKRPSGPEKQPIREFENAEGTVIHAEDHRPEAEKGVEPLQLYLPINDPRLNGWFKSEPPTTLFMYLYPPGSLSKSGSAPTTKPQLYVGEIGMHARNLITGTSVNCEIADFDLPQLKTVPSGNIPERKPGVVAQAVGTLSFDRTGELPVYVQGKRPCVEVKPRIDDSAGQTDVTDETFQVPAIVRHYFTPESFREGSFAFCEPVPQYSLSIKIPGVDLYPLPPDQIIRPILEHPDRTIGPKDVHEEASGDFMQRKGFQGIEIQVDEAKEGMRFVYPVTFVFRP